MSAHGDDLRYFYAEHLGRAQIIAVTAVASIPSGKLSPGRYLVQFNTVAGAALVWVRQGKFGTVVTEAAAPSTPFDLAEDPKPRIVLMVRAAAAQDGSDSTDGLAFRTNAGTVNAVITKISRDAQ